MKQCVLLSMEHLDDFVCYDDRLLEPMARLGWACHSLPWRRQGIDWNRFDAVIIRSTWDYQQDTAAFVECLERIESSRARLENPLNMLRWNMRKHYLRELEQLGIDIVPTLWADQWTTDLLDSMDRLGSPGEYILKPQISANADDTFRLTVDELHRDARQWQSLFADRPCMLQPFLDSILEEGEYSLFYFGGLFSHAIRKTPRAEDFRVQEEHGGRLHSINPDTSMRQVSDRVMDAIRRLQGEPLYARVDLVRDRERLRLMEVELIEPSLYFNMDPDSPERFARAFDRRMQASPAQPGRE